MMWGTGFGMGWWMWLIMGAGTLAFWIAVLLLVRHLLPAGRARQGPERPQPLTLLKEGLARGDISPEEYEQRRRLIVDGH